MPSVRTQSLPRRFFERYQVEHLALCRSLSLSDSERQTCASVLLHRLMFLCFLRAGGLLQPELYSVRRELLAPGKDRSRGSTLVCVFDPAIWSTDLASKLAVSEANWHRLIAFCDAFVWRLDDESPGPDEITPDMLGVLFEKHVNQKQTGAYYTKPDITSYLAESTILPRVLDMAREHCPAAFRPGGPVWGLLRKYPDRHIRAAVRHRSALPTETQPELLARHRRCGDLRKHLRSGAVEQSNDLVTLNLDPGRLAGDLIRESEDRELLRALR